MSEKLEKEELKKYVRAAYAPDGPGALKMISLLEENGIDAFRQGGVKDIYKVGGDVFGEEIMVDPKNLAKARELLQPGGAAQPGTTQRNASVKKTMLSLLASAVLLMILLFLRGRFLT